MTLEDVVADLGASPELDVVVQAELAPGEVVVDPSSLGGSRAVDLDTALDTDETGHAYLAEDPEAAVAGPEPLPAELYSETETVAESEGGDAPYAETSPADPQSLAQMSPRAAEAIAAAEGGAPVAQDVDPQTEATAGASDTGDGAEGEGEGEGEDGEQPMNRNLLMKFISSK